MNTSGKEHLVTKGEALVHELGHVAEDWYNGGKDHRVGLSEQRTGYAVKRGHRRVSATTALLTRNERDHVTAHADTDCAVWVVGARNDLRLC